MYVCTEHSKDSEWFVLSMCTRTFQIAIFLKEFPFLLLSSPGLSFCSVRSASDQVVLITAAYPVPVAQSDKMGCWSIAELSCTPI